MGDADHAHPGVALGVAVGPELFQMGAVVLSGRVRVVGAQAGLLGQFTRRCLRQILVGPYEAAGECPAPLKGRLTPAYRQRAQGVATHGQHDQVHGDGEGREG